MERQRILGIAVAAALVLGLIFAVGGSMQHNAWMEGYTIGRLTAAAGVNGALAPAAPYLPHAFPPRGPGFGGILFLLLGGAAFFFIVSRMLHMARWRAWAMQGGAPPWMGHGGPWGCGQGQSQAQKGESQPTAAQAPPAQPPSAGAQATER